MLASIICTVLRHRPKKSLVRFDDGMFRAPCRRCGCAMIRLPAGWQLAERAQADRRKRRLTRASLALVAAGALVVALVAPRAVLKPPADTPTLRTG